MHQVDHFACSWSDDVTFVCSGGAYGMDKCPECRCFSKRWTHVRPGCRNLVDSPAPPKPTSKARPANRQPYGSIPRRVGPSPGSVGSMGSKPRGNSERMPIRKLKEAAQAKEVEDQMGVRCASSRQGETTRDLRPDWQRS